LLLGVYFLTGFFVMEIYDLAMLREL